MLVFTLHGHFMPTRIEFIPRGVGRSLLNQLKDRNLMFKAEVFVEYKDGILDPQGKAVTNALENMGYSSFQGGRVGKYITFQISEPSQDVAKTKLKEICEKMLINPNIEKYRFQLTPQ